MISMEVEKMLYIKFGADVIEIQKVWKTARAKGEKKPHAVAPHWHAQMRVRWDDTGRESVLEDVCAPGELRADDGWKEIDKTLGDFLESKGVEPLGVGL